MLLPNCQSDIGSITLDDAATVSAVAMATVSAANGRSSGYANATVPAVHAFVSTRNQLLWYFLIT